MVFLSTLSLRRATLWWGVRKAVGSLFLSTLSLRRATDVIAVMTDAQSFLSTLSLRRATHLFASSGVDFTISIHALLAESDASSLDDILAGVNFYPRSPCGERRLRHSASRWRVYFYPRSPCGERLRCFNASQNRFGFLSTLSLRRATRLWHFARICCYDFYPRSPCGERQTKTKTNEDRYKFLSTLSLRRATAKVHKTVGHFCAYETNFMEIASSC